MAVATMSLPDMELRLVIAKPRGYRVRIALLTSLLWLAARVAPSCIDVQTEIKPAA